MGTGYSMEEENDINSEPIDLGNELADQETTDVIDPARRVPFILKKASIRKQYADNNDKNSGVTVVRLGLDAAIGSDGVDGEGKYANKHIFTDLVIWFDKSVYSGEWWEKKARGPAKMFFTALDFDVTQMPKIDAEFVTELAGREFSADILKRPVQEKTSEIGANGKAVYANTGEYKNELGNFRQS